MRNFHFQRRPEVLLALFLSACAGGPVQEPKSAERGAFASPEQLTFVCVTPGCDTRQTVRIDVLGDRRLAIKRMVLEGEAKGDFEVVASQQPPFILGVSDDFSVEVRYRPTGAPAAENARVVVSYTDASATEGGDRVTPGEVTIPLVRRLVGEPVLVVHPERLSFGAVPKGQTRSLPLSLRNEGFGNVTMALVSLDAGVGPFQAQLPAERTLAPDAGVSVPVDFAPLDEAYSRSELVIESLPANVAKTVVTLEGTSLATARIALEASTEVSFGELPKKQKKTRTLQLMNQGGAELTVTGVSVLNGGGNLKARLVAPTLPTRLAALSRLPLELELDGQVPGTLNATVKVFSNDPARPAFDLHVVGTITEPRLTITPALLDFGTVPVGWVQSKQLELKNTGSGGLTLKNLGLVSGSSALFTLRQIPGVPAVLEPDERVTVEVEFRAESSASFSGYLSIESDDPIQGFVEVPLKALGGSCTAGCPISNGTPACASGTCAVGACNAGFFDTDKLPSTGCECKELGSDPGAFCADALYKGVLKDNDKTATSHTGIVPLADDVDVLRFYAEDAFALFDENFNVKIRLESNDPGISLCVYRQPNGSHQSECHFLNELCPSNRTFERKGGNGEDGADYIVKVVRTASSKPTCTPYTVYMSNGK